MSLLGRGLWNGPMDQLVEDTVTEQILEDPFGARC